MNINLLHPQYPKKTKRAFPVKRLAGMALLIAVVSLGVQHKAALIESVGLLDQYVLNDFSVSSELAWQRHNSTAFVARGEEVIAVGEVLAAQDTQSASLPATVIVHTEQQPITTISETYIDHLILFNLEQVIAQGWLGNSSSSSSSSGFTDRSRTVYNYNTGIGDEIPDATEGSVLFAGAEGRLAQDNNNFFYDDANNRLGIGIAAPAYVLDVSGGTGIVGQFSGRVIGGAALNSNEFTTKSQLDALTSGAAGAFIQEGNSFGTLAVLGTNDANSLAIETGGTERLRIDTSGNVGIGTATPAYPLTVGNGDLFGVDSSGAIAAATGITSSGNIDFASLNAGGLVKADATTGRLSVATAGTDYENPLTFGNGLTRTTNAVALGGTLTENTTIANAGFNFNITGAGNVGIGTNNPQTLLNVQGSSTQLRLGYDATHYSQLSSDAAGNLAVTTQPNGTISKIYYNGNPFIQISDDTAASFSIGPSANPNMNSVDFGNTAVGYQTLFTQSSSFFNTGVGTYALYATTTGNSNTALGYATLTSNTTGSANTAVGRRTLLNVTTGSSNTGLGDRAGQAITTGNANVALGAVSLLGNIIGSNNTAVGVDSLLNTTTNGNVGIGYFAGALNTTGTNNTFIGNNAGNTGTTGTLTNATAIGYNTQVTASNSLILGNGANVGIGTTSPGAKLEVNGSQLFGNANTIQWRGSAGTIAGSVLQLYTDDNVYLDSPVTGGQLIFRNNGTSERMRILANGNVGIGTASPNAKLSVNGNISLNYNTIDLGGLAGDPSYQMYVGGDGINLKGYSGVIFNTVIGGEVMRVSGSNVGIGTTLPSSKLQIVGTGTFGAAGVSALNLSAHTVTLGTNPATFRAAEVGAMTLAASSAKTVTTASSLYVNTPVAGSNVTITNNKPIDTATTAYLSSGGTWTNASSRERKENFVALDPQEVLDKIDNLSIERWNYKAEDSSITHIGPVAEEFYAAFNTGGTEGDKSISTIDPAGVALLGIQGLSAKVKTLLNFSWVIEEFKKFGVVIEQNIIKIKTLAVDRLQIGSADKPSGFVMYDEDTKEAYCVKIKSGEFIKTKGDCSDNSAAPLSEDAVQAPTEQAAPETNPEPSQTQETAPNVPVPSESQDTASVAQ